MVAKNKSLVSMAQQFSGLPMKDLIGAPLVAAAQANNMMAMTQTRFLLETCFELGCEGDREIYKPIMIDMTITRSVVNADGTAAESSQSPFTLPLLTLIPLNSLAVDQINVSFEMEVKSSFACEDSDHDQIEENHGSTISKKISETGLSAELTGAVGGSDKSDSSKASSFKKSNSAKYEISAHAGQIPLPIGVTTIIETFTQSIAPIHLKTMPK